MVEALLLGSMITTPLCVFLVVRVLRESVEASIRASMQLHETLLHEQRAFEERFLQHLEKTAVVGGNPVDLAKRAYDVAEEKNRIEAERVALERERLASRNGAGAFRRMSPEG